MVHVEVAMVHHHFSTGLGWMVQYDSFRTTVISIAQPYLHEHSFSHIVCLDRLRRTSEGIGRQLNLF